jgi:16S rRNA (guanine966-N2)-methyltransferase
MRVIAGTFGGRRLQAPKWTATRPTSDRVREALSRGAAHAVFVDTERAALVALRANLAALGLGAAVAEVRSVDALRALREAPTRGEAYDLVLLDPPYRLAGELGGGLGDGLAGVLAGGARVVSESDRRSPLDLDLPITHERRYGDTLIRIHEA